MKSFSKKNLFLWIIVFASIKSIYSQIVPEDIVHVSRIDNGLNAPVRMAVDHFDNIYLTDVNEKRILKFDPSGNLLATQYPEISPLSLAVDGNNQLFIGSDETGYIYKLESDGNLTEFYSGTLFPNSMVFDADGLLYVVDSELKKVIVLDLSANVIQIIGDGTLIYPTGIAYNPNNNTLLVAEHGGLGTGFNPEVKVWMFNLDGTLIGSFGKHGNGEGEFYRIQGITTGNCGNIFVTDPFQAQISIFDQNGSYITRFGEFGSTEGQLNVPLDIVSNSQNQLLISSLNNSAFDVYGIDSALPTAKMNSLNTIICQGESTDIEIEFTGTAPWTFTYTVDGLNPIEINNITENRYVLTVSEPGTYEVSALNDANSAGTCFTGKTKIEVNSDPPSSNISNGDVAICTGESTDIAISFTGLPPWIFTYTKDGSDPKTVTTTNNPYLLNVTEAGLYEVIALEGGGCSGSIYAGTAQVSMNPLPTSTITIGNATVLICEGQSTDLNIDLTGSPPWTFTYTNDDTNPVTVENVHQSPYTISVSDQGTYEVKLVSDQNCINTKSVGYPDIVKREAPVPGFDFNHNAMEISFINISLNSDSYLWDFGDTKTSTETNPVHTYSSPGDYIVTLTSYNENCGDVAFSDTLTVLQLPVESIVLDDILSLYPNPTTGLLTIELINPVHNNMKIEIYNLHGQKIYSLQFNPNEGKEIIDLGGLPKGIYMVRVTSEDMISSGKLILSR